MTQRAIVLTGASTGIGFATAGALARYGFAVYAGVRSNDDAQRVGALHELIQPIILDVTDGDQIAAARARVLADGLPLAGVVNNAGIAVSGPLEFLPVDYIRKQFEINTFAPMSVAQAFLEPLRAAHGRLVFVGSIAGRMSAPFVGPYSASKAALASLVDALRMELHDSGVGVSLLEFAAVRTPIWAKGRSAKDEMLAALPPLAHERYGTVVERVVDLTRKEEATGMEPSQIAEVILDALTAARPRERYVIGRRARFQAVAAVLPARTKDKLVRKAMGLA